MPTNTINKSLVPISFGEGLNLEAQLQLKELSVAPTQVTGYILVYAKDDGLLYQKLPDGTESKLGVNGGISEIFMKPSEMNLDAADSGAEHGVYLIYGTIDFSATVKGTAWGSFKLPLNWDITKNINCDIYYNMNGADDSHNILLNGDFWSIASGETPVPATPHDSNAYTLSSGISQNNKMKLLAAATSSIILAAASIAAGDLVTIKFWRDAAVAGDTYTGVFQLIGLRFYQV